MTMNYEQHNLTLIHEHTFLSELLSKDKDSIGAIMFIVVVLFWYSLGMVCMLCMQIKARDEIVGNCAKRRAGLLIEKLRTQTHTKQILEELVDKQKRDKLWDIYLGRKDNSKLMRDETLRIRNIEKQLAVINQNRILINERLLSPSNSNRCLNFDSQSIMVPDFSSMENRVRVRRRSSFDQQIIERWKTLVEQCKTPEQLPWTIQKLMIRRHFRRYCKMMLETPPQLNSSSYERQRDYGRNSLISTNFDEESNRMPTADKYNYHVLQIDDDHSS